MDARTALVVDDDVEIAELVALILSVKGGWRAQVCHDGREAVRLAAVHVPDVVLLDVMMPGLDGPATWRALRADPRTSRIPVILLTAKVSVDGPPAWDGLDVAGVIAKPFSARTLAAEVEHLLAATAVPVPSGC